MSGEGSHKAYTPGDGLHDTFDGSFLTKLVNNPLEDRKYLLKQAENFAWQFPVNPFIQEVDIIHQRGSRKGTNGYPAWDPHDCPFNILVRKFPFIEVIRSYEYAKPEDAKPEDVKKKVCKALRSDLLQLLESNKNNAVGELFAKMMFSEEIKKIFSVKSWIGRVSEDPSLETIRVLAVSILDRVALSKEDAATVIESSKAATPLLRGFGSSSGETRDCLAPFVSAPAPSVDALSSVTISATPTLSTGEVSAPSNPQFLTMFKDAAQEARIMELAQRANPGKVLDKKEVAQVFDNM